MKQYTDLVETVMRQGTLKPNRTGVDTISYFAHHAKYPLRGCWPIVTTKELKWKLVLTELLWYLRGDDHIRFLWENNNHIWDEWAGENGYLGPAYSVLWRKFPKISNYQDFVDDKKVQGDENMAETYVHEYDQIKNIDNLLANNPMSRRIVLSTWYPGLEGEMGLPPCHLLAIWNCTPIGSETRLNMCDFHSKESADFSHNLQGGRIEGMTKAEIIEKFDELGIPKYVLNCHMTQRSADIALGVPFNIACYSALTKVFAHIHNMVPGTFSHLLVDAHIYENHVDGLMEQVKRQHHPLPDLKISDRVNSIDDITMDDFEVTNYVHEPAIKFDVAV